MSYDEAGAKEYIVQHGADFVRNDLENNAGINIPGPMRAPLKAYLKKMDSPEATPIGDILDYKIILLTQKLAVLLGKWIMFRSSHSLSVQRFDGKLINYAGIGFTGSPIVVFQNFFKPYIQDGLFNIIRECEVIYKQKEVQPGIATGEVISKLKMFVNDFYEKLLPVGGDPAVYKKQQKDLEEFILKQTKAHFFQKAPIPKWAKWVKRTILFLLGGGGLALSITLINQNISTNGGDITAGNKNEYIAGDYVRGDKIEYHAGNEEKAATLVNQQSVKMITIDADRKKSELTVILRNYGSIDISTDATVWIGIFPYFGSYNSDHIQWIKSDSKQDIPVGMRGEFTIKHIIEPHMAVVVAIEGKEFPNGLLLDEAGILYTWDYWQYKGWLPWRPYKTSVTQTPKMEMALDKFNRCAHAHSIDRDYSSCFK